MATKSTTDTYENNPLLIATKGLDLLFKSALSVAILLLVFMGLNYLSSIVSAFIPAPEESAGPGMESGDIAPLSPAIALAIIGVVTFVLLIVLFVSIVVKGISDYTSAKLAKGEQVSLGEALGAVFSHFFGYAWVTIIVAVKTFLWSLLFIIPGIIMSVRYSLAGVSYFDKKLSGNAAVKDSLALTKGAWLTTYAAQNLLPLLTLGVLQGLTGPGTSAVLYRQYNALGNQPKPKAHIASWLTLVAVIVFIVLFIGIILLIVAILTATYASTAPPPPTPHGYI